MAGAGALSDGLDHPIEGVDDLGVFVHEIHGEVVVGAEELVETSEILGGDGRRRFSTPRLQLRFRPTAPGQRSEQIDGGGPFQHEPGIDATVLTQ